MIYFLSLGIQVSTQHQKWVHSSCAIGRHKVSLLHMYLKSTLSPIHASWIVIRILYPERNPDHPQNLIEYSLAHIW